MRELAEIKVLLRSQSKEIEKLRAENIILLRNTAKHANSAVDDFELPDGIQLPLSSEEEIEFLEARLGCDTIKKSLVSNVLKISITRNGKKNSFNIWCRVLLQMHNSAEILWFCPIIKLQIAVCVYRFMVNCSVEGVIVITKDLNIRP